MEHDDDRTTPEDANTEALHPLLGSVRHHHTLPDPDPVFALPGEPPQMRNPFDGPGMPERPGSFIGKMFCDGCGFTGGHAPDCPAEHPPEPPMIHAAGAYDDEAPESADDDAVIPHARRLVGAILRKVARVIEGGR